MLRTIVFRVSSKKNLEIKVYKTIVLPVVLCGCETWSLTVEGRTYVESVWELAAEENVWI